MCGLAGLWAPSGVQSHELLAASSARMAGALRHRGPDDGDVWVENGLALAHRRLAVIDLSEAGHQPMASRSRRFVIAFNGEIYNHLDLRRELETSGAAHAWRGHSDTETLLAAIEHWGLERTLARCVGMFALAVWDRESQTLRLGRDRFGEKPLYYGWVGGRFAFASELKALRESDGFDNRISNEALAQYLRFTYVPAPRSIYAGIYKLEPGCMLTIVGAPPASAPAQPLRAGMSHGSVNVDRWWSLATAIDRGAADPICDEAEAVAAVERTLSEAVSLQSISDVPLGAFLSGGVDSSLIVALMQKQSTRAVKTFTIAFDEPEFDESPHARRVAAHLGTEHSELLVTSAEAQSVIARLPAMYDEPFADSSQIPTYLVCGAARRDVTVALSGDAGDELFGGYNRYFWGPRIWNNIGWLPHGARRALAAVIRAVPVSGWDAANQTVSRFLPKLRQLARPGDKAHKLAARLDTIRGREDLYLSLVSEWQFPASILMDPALVEPASLLADPLPETVRDEQSSMMYRDAMTYLPDDILCKVDRAAMAVSLETRVPFLDHRVAELAWRLPLSMKIRDSKGKWVLRQVLDKYVPRSLIERPKAGFGIPVGEWLRGPLRTWAEELLDPERLRQQGFLRPEPIQAVWRSHLSGRQDWTHRLWSVLMFQAWLEANH